MAVSSGYHLVFDRVIGKCGRNGDTDLSRRGPMCVFTAHKREIDPEKSDHDRTPRLCLLDQDADSPNSSTRFYAIFSFSVYTRHDRCSLVAFPSFTPSTMRLSLDGQN